MTRSGGGGDKHLLSFHGLHLPHLSLGGGGGGGGPKTKDMNSSSSSSSSAHGPTGPTTPKGCAVVRVGREGEEPERFVVPVGYLNHPLFARLLKDAEEEYGFEQQGAITIPCHAEYFRQVRGMIDKETSLAGGAHGTNHHLPLSGCFKA